MDDPKFYYDIFTTSQQGQVNYEGTISFPTLYIPYNEMLTVACLEKNYPNLAHRENVTFIPQESPAWFSIMKEFKK